MISFFLPFLLISSVRELTDTTNHHLLYIFRYIFLLGILLCIEVKHISCFLFLFYPFVLILTLEFARQTLSSLKKRIHTPNTSIYLLTKHFYSLWYVKFPYCSGCILFRFFQVAVIFLRESYSETKEVF